MANLSAHASQAIEHWRRYRPALYRELKERGRLEEAAKRAVELTGQEFAVLVEKGASHDQAWEAVREKYLYLPSQEDQPNLGENPDYFPDPASSDPASACEGCTPPEQGHRP